MSRQAEVIKSWLALEAWRYGHHYGGDQAMTNIACAIANRVRNGWGNWWQVLRDIPIHSALNADELPTGYPNPSDPAFLRLLVNIDKIYNGEFDDKKNGAYGGVFFGDLGHITREWFLKNIVRNPAEHPQAGSLATLTFWK